MRSACVLVGNSRNNFREAAAEIDIRLRLLRDHRKQALVHEARILLLPAGFFCVSSQQEREALIKELERELRDAELVAAFSIDQLDEGPFDKRHAKGESKNSSYGSFGYVMERGRVLLGPVKQIGIHVDEVSHDEIQVDERIAWSQVLGGRLALLLCGELLSSSWRVAMADRKPDLVLHPAHASVVLAGDSKESWAKKIEDLLQRLPPTSIYMFADHVTQQEHRAPSGQRAELVRCSRGSQGREIANFRADSDGVGWMYVYETMLVP